MSRISCCVSAAVLQSLLLTPLSCSRCAALGEDDERMASDDACLWTQIRRTLCERVCILLAKINYRHDTSVLKIDCVRESGCGCTWRGGKRECE